MRTAAIVGTAGAVSHHQQQKYAAKDQQAAEQQAYEQQPVYEQAPPPPPPPAQADPTEELTKLAELHSQGILTDEEFSAKKAQILGI